MMGTVAHTGDTSLRLLVFTVGGVSLAADAEQICSMVAYDRDTAGDVAFRLHEMLSFGNREVTYRAPEILNVKWRETIHGIVVDQPEDIITIAMNRIRPLPALIEPFFRKKGLWGVVTVEGRMILLIDFHKMLNFPRNIGPDAFVNGNSLHCNNSQM